MFSMTQLVRRAAQINGDGLATWDGARQQTWNQFQKRIATFAGGLKRLGLEDGDRVAMLALNSDRYFEFLFAVPWAGGVFVPINTRLAAPEFVYWLNSSGAKVVFVDTSFIEIIDSIRDQLTDAKHFILVDDGETRPGWLSYNEIIDTPPIADVGRADHDMAGLYYTGGTTGRSKGVMLSHNNLVVNAFQGLPVLHVAPGEKTLHVAPMFHIADGWICMSSATQACANYFYPAFAPELTAKAIQTHKIERALLVPTMVNMLVNHPGIEDFDLTSIRTIAYGASPMPEPVIRRAMEIMPGTDFYQAYGQTETAPCLTVLGPERHTFEGPLAGKMKSAGRPLPGIDLQIRDEDDKEVKNGVVGEICVRGPNVMLGYRNMPEQTAATIMNGWLHTGDGGYLDDDGFVFIVDRVKDMIVSGGENVYSAETENAIYLHEAVDQCAVIGIPHEKWGEQVHAVVVLKAGQTVDETTLIEHCKQQIAGFKCPRSISFQDEPLPLSGAGKILKTELRKPFWGDQGRNVN